METVLITGASNGIGEELAKIFAKEGYHLILVARSEDKLNQMANFLSTQYGVQTHVFVQDLSVPQSASKLYQEVKNKGLSVDVLVNNAGFGKIGKFIQQDVQSISEMMHLNMATLTELTSLFLPEMKRNNKGKILNIASTAAFQSVPRFAVYAATKAYVLSFTEALHYELKGTGISVTALCPGPVNTGFAKRADGENNNLFKNAMDSKTVAEVGYQALMNNKMYEIVGFKNKFLAYLSRIIPSRRLHIYIVDKMF